MNPVWLRAVVNGWWIVVLTGLVAIAAAVTATILSPDRYLAATTVVVAPDPILEEPNDIVRAFESLVSAGVVSNYAEILLSDSAQRTAAAELALGEEERERYDIDAAVLPESTVIEVIVRGPDAAIAASLANTLAALGAERFESLYRLYEIQTLQEALPPEGRDAPRPVRDVGLAAVLGVLLGGGLAILREQYQTKGSWAALAAPDPPAPPTASAADRPAEPPVPHPERS
jgi:capsular polysaccharide biosynthesis protein